MVFVKPRLCTVDWTMDLNGIMTECAANDGSTRIFVPVLWTELFLCRKTLLMQSHHLCECVEFVHVVRGEHDLFYF